MKCGLMLKRNRLMLSLYEKYSNKGNFNLDREPQKYYLFFFQTYLLKMFNCLIGHICLICLEPS